MFKLKRAFRDYDEAGSLNEQINLLGFIDDQVFLTKSGDLGMVLSVGGVDYECLAANEIDHCTKRVEAAFKIFDENCRVYQYLLKRNGAAIPYQKYENPIVSAAIESRIAYLQDKAENLYDLEIYYVVLLETDKTRKAWGQLFHAIGRDPKRALSEVRASMSSRGEISLIAEGIERNRNRLEQKVSSFILQVSDFLDVKALSKQESFRFLKRLLNFDSLKIEYARLNHDTFLDYQLCESHLECHRGFLRVDDDYVKVLTLKEPSAQSFPLIFQKLLEVGANFFITTEWKKESPDKTRSRIHSRRRHFHNTKRSLVSYMNTSDTATAAQDILIDDSKEAQVRSLGEALKELEVKGSYFGDFSQTIVIYDLDLMKVES